MAIPKIVIDAGHGMNTAGKRCMKKLDSKETREWWLNDRIADKLERELANYKCEVLRSDDTTGLTDVSLSNRVKKANNYGADYFLSIHHNAGIYGGKGGGTVIYYCSSKAERKVQAKALYDAVVAQTKLVGNRSDKIKKYGYYVVKKTKMPALLLENGFMDSSVDVPIILTEDHADKTVKGILNFLVAELNLKKVTTEPTTLFKVRVKVAELNYRSGPGVENTVKGTIRDKGVYTIVETAKAKDGGTWGRLKSGAGWINIGSKYVSKI